MSEMTERVASVIAAELMELTASQRATFIFPDDVNGDTCDRARSAANAVIKAMREPTEAMVNAAYDQQDPGFADEPGTSTPPDECWHQMIDAILATEPTS